MRDPGAESEELGDVEWSEPSVRRDARDRGATVVEYAMGLTFGALLAFAAVQFATQQIDATFDSVMNETQQPMVDGPPPPPPPPPTTTTAPPCRRWCR